MAKTTFKEIFRDLSDKKFSADARAEGQTAIGAPASDDEKAWDAVLSDPSNQKTLAELARSLRGQAQSGALGAPALMDADRYDVGAVDPTDKDGLGASGGSKI